MPSTVGPTARLCEWVCSTDYGDIPEDVRQEAVTIVYDTVGGMLAASTLPSCQPVIELAKAMAPNGDCTIIGQPAKTILTLAALANGTIGHGDEVDATGQGGTGHFAAGTVPAALTVGQYVKALGKEVLRALVLGSEVASRIGNVMAEFTERSRRRGWGANTMGTAVVAGVMLKLDQGQMEHALALAASQVCGLNSVFHDPTHHSKSLQSGLAVQGGVLAALLAERGYHGAPEILGSEQGFFDAFAGYGGLAEQVVVDLGKEYQMRQIAFKRYPVGGPNQAPVGAFLELKNQHGIQTDDIDFIEVVLSRDAFQTVATLKHPSVHMPTILSLAAVFGEVTFRHIHEARYYEDPRVEAFKARIRLLPEPGRVAYGNRLQAELRIRTRDGKVIGHQLRYQLMTQEEIQKKFRTLAGLRLSPDRVTVLESRLQAIETLDDTAPLVASLGLE